MATKTVGELLALGNRRLESEILLAYVLGVDRAWLYAHGDDPVEGAQRQGYESLIKRRANGEPVAYLTGEREFWSLPLKVTPDVLIPRPETELLIECALDFLPPEANWRVADLGTGSGAVALAIAKERPRCAVHATEISEGALEVARQNGEALLPGRVQFHAGSWLEPLDGRFHLIVSNPPYVPAGDAHLEQGDCRFEPRSALTDGLDGLSAIRHIARDSLEFLEPGGMLAFEHGWDQGEAARHLLHTLGYGDVETRKDLEGRDRVTLGINC